MMYVLKAMKNSLTGNNELKVKPLKLKASTFYGADVKPGQ
jgi:hypothetical protein